MSGFNRGGINEVLADMGHVIDILDNIAEASRDWKFYVWRLGFLLGHLGFCVLAACSCLTATTVHDGIKKHVIPFDNAVAISAISFAALFLVYVSYYLAKGLYHYILKFFIYLDKYQAAATIIAAALHHLMTLQVATRVLLQMMFAVHIFSFVCYTRSVVGKDPSGLIRSFSVVFAQTATYFFVIPKEHGAGVAYLTVSVISTLALIFDKGKTPTSLNWFDRILQSIGDFGEALAGHAGGH